VTGVSISALFTGGLLPAFVLGITLCFLVWWRYRREDLSSVQRPTRKVILRSLAIALPALLLPFVIRAAVVEGIATATEVSTIGIFYAVIVGILFYRQFPLGRIYPMLVTTAGLSGAILLIIGAATGMAWALTQSGFSGTLAATLKSLLGGAPIFLIVSAFAFIVLGSVLEGIPAIVLFGPLMFPIARQVGVHEVHYAMVVIWGSVFSPRHLASATTQPARSAGFIPIKGSSRSSATSWLSSSVLQSSSRSPGYRRDSYKQVSLVVTLNPEVQRFGPIGGSWHASQSSYLRARRRGRWRCFTLDRPRGRTGIPAQIRQHRFG
jgi:hypothetical protein